MNLRALVGTALLALVMGCGSSTPSAGDDGTGDDTTGATGGGGGAAGTPKGDAAAPKSDAKAAGGSTGGGGTTKGTGGTTSAGTGGSTGGGAGNKSAGCGKAPTINPDTAQNPGWPYFYVEDNPQLTMQINGKSRTFTIFIPKTGDYDQDTPIPLYFSFHGCGGGSSPTGFIDAFGYQAIVIAPQGLAGSCGGSTTGWLNAKGSEDYDFFDAMLKWATEGFCVDKNQIFGSGHSHGGMFMGALGCYRGDVFRAISPESASPQGQTDCVGQVAYLGLHHVDDGTVPISGGEKLRDMYATANHCGTTTKPYVGFEPCVQYDGCDAAFPVYWCPITGPMIDAWSNTDVGAHNVWAWPKTGSSVANFELALSPKP